MPDSKVVFLGFDAAEQTLVRQGIEQGWLPTLARLVETGRFTPLSPVPSGFYNTSWASTVTGQDVLAHQAIFDRQLVSRSYRIVDVGADSIRQPPFWRYVSDAGLRSTVASIYSAPVLGSFLGAQAQGWGSIDPYFAKFKETSFDPPGIEQLLRRAAGKRQEAHHITAPGTDAEIRRYRDRMCLSVDEQTRGLVALVEETEWDFFFASYSESHQAGHLLWHLVDPDHPAHDEAAAADVKDALPAIYRAVDEGLGRVIERLPEGCSVFVLTPHGMGPNYIQDPSELLLERGGWLTRRSGVAGGGMRKDLVRAGWTLARRLTPPRLKVAAQGRLRHGGVRAEMPLAHVDWSQTQAFALPSDMTAYIRINLEGREPEGIVRPGSDYERLCEELVEALGSLTHAESGAPAVDRVVRIDRLEHGPPDGSLPDIGVVWADSEPITRLRLEGHEPVDVPASDVRTGQHRHQGFLIGAGPGIEPASDVLAASLLDVAPTALALLGVDQPQTLAGRPIEGFASPARPPSAP